MINSQLLNPESIVVVGGSNDLQKPGGKIVYNILQTFKGDLYVTNLHSENIQGQKTFKSVEDLPEVVDLAVIAIAAKCCPDAVNTLAYSKNTKAFVIISAGFSEEGEEGAQLEKEIVHTINDVGGCLIGPNCIGVITKSHSSVFTTPIPILHSSGADFISGSGATALFIIEAGSALGLKYNSIYSVGNCAQMGIEDVLEYLDESFDPVSSSRIKLLYIESISDAQKLLKHSKSLIGKECRIAAIKSGSSEEGSRAASSHTGAMANSDIAVDALFKKAGIVRCNGRMELALIAAVFMSKEMSGGRLAIVTHAGGPAVMLTDILSKGGFKVPMIAGNKAEELKSKLYKGSSVSNPIDFLATGNAQQLSDIIDACENDFDEIDGVIVIFGSSGLFPVRDVYEVIHQKIRMCRKPVYVIMPSIVNAHQDIRDFISWDNVCFPDEVMFGEAMVKIKRSKIEKEQANESYDINSSEIRMIIDNAENGYLLPKEVHHLLLHAGIPVVQETVVKNRNELLAEGKSIGFPLVMKVVGINHKSDVGGVALNVKNHVQMIQEFDRLMTIKDAAGVMLQPMLSGIELFIGAKNEENFGHVVLCGLGGIFVEVLNDVSSSLVPVSYSEAIKMIKDLKGFKILEGVRGKEGVNIQMFAEVIVRFSAMLQISPEIKEIDINPLIAGNGLIYAVDTRVRIEKG